MSEQIAPRVQRREAWLDLPAPYAGFRIKVWVNFPRRLFSDLAAAEAQEEAAALLARVVLEHNGWQDFDGTPYPPPSEVAFWDAIPDELASAVIALLRREKDILPNSILTRKGK